ncbi:phage tail assembly protein [Salinisphaera sp. SWV1]|uniref:phage tail assembly protein n=1 Tax=Salinisphaera sp. SWV1 TaxID=3454139 RepID=UPI003F83563B
MNPNPSRTAFPLSTPVRDLDGTELDKLHLREPVTGDLCSMEPEGNQNEQMVNLIASCAGIQAVEVKKLPLRDTLPMFEWLNDFLSGGAAPIGKTPSG